MQFIRLDTEEQISKLIHELPPIVAVDTEYRHFDPQSNDVPDYRTAILDSIVIATDCDTSYSIATKFIDLLSPLKTRQCIYYQNFKCDVGILARHGLNLIDTPFRDSMLLHHLIDENAEHGLDALVQHYYGDKYKAEFWSTYKKYEDASPEAQLEYECKDAIYTYRLTKAFLTLLTKRENLIDHVHRLGKALYFTEIEGIPVNTKLMQDTKAEMGGRIANYLPKLRAEFLPYCEQWEMAKWVVELDKRTTVKGKAGVPKPVFNFGSNNQIQWLLYDALKLPVLKKTEAKKPATDYETIEKLEKDYPKLTTYKNYIEIKTIYGTFVDGLLQKVRDGYIYPSFNGNGTVTGRISHSGPNMGNMPTDGPYRSFFLPSPGNLICGSDYSQLEVVIEANLTGDKNLAKIVLEGASKHDITNDEMKLNDRHLAKTINFAMGYHCGISKVRQLLKCSYPEAEYQWNKYWEVYSGCRALKLQTDKEVLSGKPIVNLVGRLRHFPDKFTEEWQLAAAQRQAYNFKIQGPGADFTNEAFYVISERLNHNYHGRALFSVHDEIVLDIGQEYVQEELQALVTTMEQVGNKHKLHIPLKAVPYGGFAHWQKA